MQQTETMTQPLSIGDLDAPSITTIGVLDRQHGNDEQELQSQSPKAFLAILYTGI